MASEEAANPGTHPATPAIPKKSLKKAKEKPEAGADAQEGRDEMVEREARIEGLTRAGRRALVLGDGQEAVGCFRKAFVLSGSMVSPQLRSACAFNLGAAYVETGKPKKGLKFLLQSQTSLGGSGEPSQDLYFSIEAAHKGLQDFPKALEHFGIAADGDSAAQAGSRARTRVRMGCCYLGMREPARAARCFLDAARCFAAAASPEAAAVALSRASSSMLQSRGFGVAEIAAVLAQCHSLCGSICDAALRGKLYGDIGLSYSQLHIFTLAAESFERALASEPEQHRAAALLQNMGAAHNALCSFGTALGWHRRAAALHGTLGNRRAQGQCFGNLAYACSQLGNHEAAAENYLHALQAFQDSGDVQGQWQACEGLGAAYFHLGDPHKAIGHYKEALTLLSHRQDTPRAAHERVVHKLTDAIQHQLCLQGHLSCRQDPGQLQLQPTQPRASRTQLRGSRMHPTHPVNASVASLPPSPTDQRPRGSREPRSGTREPRSGSRTLSLLCSLL
ncbi:tetratricopeptide repeat protein 24 [Strigops habroptila]|uniref:tetratricopeptide repeat protein 24 n=1 Tax=Strigops habroptila TaxID=2489341 RepID=UPI0011CFA275|nr:tetratricopeptide repeat protein 24 [Strigops habroptila]